MRVVAVDWSGALGAGPRHTWVAEVTGGDLVFLENGRGPDGVIDLLQAWKEDDPELLVGLDFAFSLPEWFLAEQRFDGARALWASASTRGEEWLARCETPFWGRPGRPRPDLGDRSNLRVTDTQVPTTAGIRPKSVFQISGAGAVGTGSIRGMTLLNRLAEAGFNVWPFDNGDWPRVVEIYPRLLTGPIHKSSARQRWRYCNALEWPREEFERAKAAASEDAFDAAISAKVLFEHRDHLPSIPKNLAESARIEGWIWQPPEGALVGVQQTLLQAAEGGPSAKAARRGPRRRRELEPFKALEKAIALATKVHRGQLDKVGVPYILHPLRVMHLVEEHGPVAMTAAVLHDVIEDTELELDDLRRIGVPEVAVEAVDSLSRRGRGFPPGQVTGETYEEYIERLSHNPLAVRVKIADAIDNSSPKRPLPQRPELTQRYLKTIEKLSRLID